MGMKKSNRITADGIDDKGIKPAIHPIWRGVGIILMVLVPVLGYLGSLLVIKSNQTDPWLQIPSQIIVPGPDPLILLKLILSIIIGSFVYFVLMLITFIVYRVINPKRMGPHDVMPIRWKNRNL